MIKLFSKFFDLVKIYKNDLKNIKIIMLLIINAWLFFIFWDVILLKSIHITNDNIALTQMLIILEPLLHKLGLDILNPNILKMLIILNIVILSNLIVLYFNQMLAIILLGMTARYSYKAYNTYISKDTLNYYGFEKIQDTLTTQDNSNILNEFIVNNGITDPHLILFLQNKISNISCVNKNELILNLNSSLLDYKQQLLSKLILYQKDQITELQSAKKASAWSWDSIDYWTLLKIGGGIIVVAVVVIGGYHYFSHDVTKTSSDITKKLGEDHSPIEVSNADTSNKIADESSYTSLAESLQKDLLETKHDIEVLTQQCQDTNFLLQENQKTIKDFIVNVKSKNEFFEKTLLDVQSDIAIKDLADPSNKLVEQLFSSYASLAENLQIEARNNVASLAENLQIEARNNVESLAEGLQIEARNNVAVLTQQVKSDFDIVSKDFADIDSVKNLKEVTQLIVGDLKNINDNLAEVQNEQLNLEALTSTLVEFKTDLSISLSTGLAILTFLGLPTELDDIGLDLIKRIREFTGRENVYEDAAHQSEELDANDEDAAHQSEELDANDEDAAHQSEESDANDEDA